MTDNNAKQADGGWEGAPSLRAVVRGIADRRLLRIAKVERPYGRNVEVFVSRRVGNDQGRVGVLQLLDGALAEFAETSADESVRVKAGIRCFGPVQAVSYGFAVLLIYPGELDGE